MGCLSSSLKTSKSSKTKTKTTTMSSSSIAATNTNANSYANANASRNSAEVEETLARIRSHKGVEGILIMTKEGKEWI